MVPDRSIEVRNDDPRAGASIAAFANDILADGHAAALSDTEAELAAIHAANDAPRVRTLTTNQKAVTAFNLLDNPEVIANRAVERANVDRRRGVHFDGAGWLQAAREMGIRIHDFSHFCGELMVDYHDVSLEDALFLDVWIHTAKGCPAVLALLLEEMAAGAPSPILAPVARLPRMLEAVHG